MKAVKCMVICAVAGLTTACASGAKRVDCTSRLEPINVPMEQVQQKQEQPSEQHKEQER